MVRLFQKKKKAPRCLWFRVTHTFLRWNDALTNARARIDVLVLLCASKSTADATAATLAPADQREEDMLYHHAPSSSPPLWTQNFKHDNRAMMRLPYALQRKAGCSTEQMHGRATRRRILPTARAPVQPSSCRRCVRQTAPQQP